MIAFAGYFGSGKTLNMTKELYEAHKKGAFVITNYSTSFSNLILKNQSQIIDCFREILALRENGKFIGDLLKVKNKNLYKNIYIGLDEAGVYFNAREYKEWSKFPDIMDFLLQCRKLKVEIYYTVQHPAFVDINFRRVTTQWVVFKKIPFFPLILKDMLFLPPESSNYSAGERTLRTIIWGGKSKIWNLYDTTELCFKLNSNRDNLDFNLLRSSKIFAGAEHGENRFFSRFFSSKKRGKETTD